MLTILHAADFHLESSLSGLPLEKSSIRRQELRQIPRRLADLAAEEHADLVLLAGDLFDESMARPETVRLLAQALGSLSVPVLISPGNHDFYHDHSPYALSLWPENVHIFRSREMETVEFPALNCAVHGCAFVSPHREEDPLSGFQCPDDGKIHLLCLHGEVAQSGSYAPVSPHSLAFSCAHYAALGHIHAGSSGREGSVVWAYPGCPEGRGFDETGPKGVFLIRIGGEPVSVSPKFLPLCTRQYRIESVPLDQFFRSLPSVPSPDLVRLRVTGETQNPPSLSLLTEQASRCFFYAQVWDETTLPRDLWARAEETSLTGLFLREMRSRMEESGPEDQDLLLLAARFGLAALEGEEEIRP